MISSSFSTPAKVEIGAIREEIHLVKLIFSAKTEISGENFSRTEEKILLSAKLQNATISLSAMPINRRCGLLFGKVSPPFRLSFIGCPLKRENGRHEMWPNVFFKPLRALEYGEFY